MTLFNKTQGDISIVKDIAIDDKELKKFLLTLGCFKGEKILLINKKKNNLIISINGAKYSIDKNLAKNIIVEV